MKREIQEYYIGKNFPISMRVKPTNHSQLCFKCGEAIDKLTLQVKIRDGSWVREIGTRPDMGTNKYESRCRASHFYEKPCGVVHSGNNSPHFHATRYLYLHPDCFFCLIKMLALDAGANIKGCNECKDRFKCFTNSEEGFSHDASTPGYRVSAKPKVFTKTGYAVDYRNRLEITPEQQHIFDEKSRKAIEKAKKIYGSYKKK